MFKKTRNYFKGLRSEEIEKIKYTKAELKIMEETEHKQESLRMVFDSGSRILKCAICTSNGDILAIESYFPEIMRSEDGFERIYEPTSFWQNVKSLAKRTMDNAKINPKMIKYITSGSIRPSKLFTDDAFNPIIMAASFDLRGIDVAEEIDARFLDHAGIPWTQASGHSPSLLFAPARYGSYLESDFYKREPKISQYLPFDSWLLIKFGAEPHANYASAAESGFFDITSKCWHDAWYSIFDLPEEFFPIPVQSGHIVGSVNEGMQRELGLSSDCDLVAGLPDSQSAVLGMGLIEAGSIVSILGSTTPVQGLSDRLSVDPKAETWTTLISCKNLVDSYIIEANTGITGQVVKWAAQIYGSAGKSESEKFGILNELYRNYDAEELRMEESEIVTKGVFANLGPSPLSSSNTGISQGKFVFGTPGGVEEASHHIDSFACAIYDNIQFAINKNIEIIRNKIGLGLEKYQYGFCGGITKSKTLTQRISDLLNHPIIFSAEPEATIQGLNILCSVAEKTINSKLDLQNYIKQRNLNKLVNPRPQMHQKLAVKKSEWEKLFQK